VALVPAGAGTAVNAFTCPAFESSRCLANTSGGPHSAVNPQSSGCTAVGSSFPLDKALQKLEEVKERYNQLLFP